MPLDSDTKNMLDMLQQMGVPDFADTTPEQARAMSLSAPPAEPTAVASVADQVLATGAGNVPVRIYRPENPNGAALMYFHGGGWVVGSIESHDETCRELCSTAAVTVISVDYRLAPETIYPGAVEDCFAATAYIAEHASDFDIDPNRIAVGGDSAGGNLAAAVALMARDQGTPALAFQLLIYPVTDANFERQSCIDNAEGYFLTTRAMRWFWDHYVPDEAMRNEPLASPLQAANLANLPPALLLTAEFDPLRDEGEAFAAALSAAGNAVTHTRYDGLVHGFFGMQQTVAAARPAMQQASAALRAALAP
ncbi:MAG: alpha/beta hydrolase [Pseudomonadales bacterium]